MSNKYREFPLISSNNITGSSMYKPNSAWGKNKTSLFNTNVRSYFTMCVAVDSYFCVDCVIHDSYNLNALQCLDLHDHPSTLEPCFSRNEATWATTSCTFRFLTVRWPKICPTSTLLYMHGIANHLVNVRARGELVLSYRWTGWSSRLQESYRSS